MICCLAGFIAKAYNFYALAGPLWVVEHHGAECDTGGQADLGHVVGATPAIARHMCAQKCAMDNDCESFILGYGSKCGETDGCDCWSDGEGSGNCADGFSSEDYNFYRLAEHSSCVTESSCSEQATALGLSLGGNNFDFAGDYTIKGCYTYAAGAYEGLAFFSAVSTSYTYSYNSYT